MNGISQIGMMIEQMIQNGIKSPIKLRDYKDLQCKMSAFVNRRGFIAESTGRLTLVTDQDCKSIVTLDWDDEGFFIENPKRSHPFLYEIIIYGTEIIMAQALSQQEFEEESLDEWI